MGRGFDQRRAGQAFAAPGMDTRQWVSVGTVDDGTSDAPPYQLDDGSGGPPPYGPLVHVTLQPSGISLPCRVSSAVAGDHEGEWYPFSPGDEVIVVIPQGHERSGAVIIGRLNQELDVWPQVVAGQDATKNTFGFRRMRTSYIVETAGAYLIRSAKTGTQIGIDADGNLLLNDGDKGSLSMGAEVLGFTSGDGSSFIQVLPPTKEVYLGADTATFLLNATESKFISQAGISFATSGGAASQHAVTAEQVVAFVMNVLAQMASTACFDPMGPLSSMLYGAAPPASCQAAISTIVGPALLALGTGTAPLGPAAGGEFAEFLASAPPIFGPAGALTTAMASPLPPVDPTGTVFGFGRPGFKL